MRPSRKGATSVSKKNKETAPKVDTKGKKKAQEEAKKEKAPESEAAGKARKPSIAELLRQSIAICRCGTSRSKRSSRTRTS